MTLESDDAQENESNAAFRAIPDLSTMSGTGIADQIHQTMGTQDDENENNTKHSHDSDSAI